MKKLFALLAIALGVVACQKDHAGMDVNMGGEQEVMINVSLPEETRANSAEGAFSNVDFDDYDVRFQCEVHYGDQKKSLETQYSDNGKTATFPVRLIPGRDYKFVVWADLVEEDTTADLHYITNTDAGLSAITLNGAWNAMDETRDAYTCSEVRKFTGDGISLTLTRPFAKLRVKTTDMKELLGVRPASAVVEYKTPHYAKFNAVEGDVVATETITTKTHTYDIADIYEKSETTQILFTDYFFAKAEQEAVKFNMFVNMDDGKPVVNRSFTTDIPVKRNHLTTIMGDILTDGNNIVVNVVEGFEQPENLYEIWDGLSVSEPAIENDPVSGEPVGVIDSAADLAWLAQYVNGTIASTFATRGNEVMNFVLKADIDLNNQPWIGIGTEENNFVGTFDGNGHKIANLNLVETEAKEGKAFIGFFGYAKNATIKNLTFENVNINIPCLDIDHSQGHIGAVAGSLEGTSTIENVTVKGDIKVEATVTANGASRVAVVAGGNSYGNVTMKNVHVIANERSYLKANNNVGALAGQLQGVSVFENCSSNIDVTGTKFFAGGIIGLAAGDQTFTNCHTTGNITITAGREGKAHDHYRVGGIAGGWADGAKNVCTLTNCSYTGELSGTNADGSVADVFDYAGYVGRGYTLNGCQGSKVVIDGDEYVQAYNTAAEAGIYYVNGELILNNAAALKLVASKVNNGVDYFEGKTIKLGANIDLNNEEWTPIGSAYKDHGFMGNFDGNGKIIKNLKITNIALDADGYAYAGLFGVTEGVDKDNQNYIKNLIIENVNIETEGHIVAAAIAYPYYTNLENIKVQGNVAIEGGDYTSGVLAYTRRCVDAKNIAIEANNGVIKGNMTIGGVISDIQMNGGLTANYSNFAASGLTIEGVMHVGGISGILSKQTLNGATVKNVTIVCNDVRKGKISGSLGEDSAINGVVVENVAGANNLVGATYKEGTTHTLTVDGVVYEYLANGTYMVDGKVVVDNNDQFQAAIAAGETSIVLGKGTFDLPSSLTQNEGTLTIIGAGVEETILNGAKNSNANHPGNYANGVALEFEGLTFKTANNGYNGGFGHAVSVTFRESKIVGQFYAHSNAPHYFYDCTIDPLTGYLYTYGSDCVFEGCTFAASEGKALQVYEDSASGENTVTITNCAFVAAKQATTWDGKPVTGIDINSNGAKFTVNINNCTTSGFPTGLNSYSDLWNVKDGGKAHANVYVDGALVWKAGSIANGVILNDKGEYLISTAAGMFWFANEVNVNKNTFNGKIVKLGANINLENAAWTPVGQTGATTFNGVFNGQNYTISNLNVNSEAQTGEHYSSGLFGWVESHTAGHGHLKNVKIEGATINGHHNCGALVGYITQETALVENCHVTGATVTCTKANNDADGDKAGALIGNATVATPVKDCTATNSTVSAGRDAGQVIGTGKEANVTGCSATNVTVSANGTGTGANIRNEVIGRLL